MKFVGVLALCISAVAGFAPVGQTNAKSTGLNMINEKKFAASFLTAAFIATNAMSAATAFAAFDFGSSEVVAAKSGGRSGGRASSGSYAKSTPSKSSVSNTKVIQKTTIIQQPVYTSPTVVMAPSYGYAPPAPGLGLAVGLSTINSIGNAMQDARQESEIRDTREQLRDAKMKEAEMESRMRQLEMNQMYQAARAGQ